jgi:hypothetical protein
MEACRFMGVSEVMQSVSGGSHQTDGRVGGGGDQCGFLPKVTWAVFGKAGWVLGSGLWVVCGLRGFSGSL